MNSFKILLCTAVLFACGCIVPHGSTDAGFPGVLPQVTLTVENSTVIGNNIKGSVTVSQCAKVTQVQLLASDQSFIADANFSGNPTQWQIAPDLLNRFYAAKGIALPLSLIAKVVCDDGRTNLSQTVSVTYMPVATVRSTPGVQVLPDSFIAEGGLGGTATTFLGCIQVNDAYVLARLDTNGTIVAKNEGLPFNCSANSVITERSNVNFTRWLLEPGLGAAAFDKNLNITNFILGKFQRIGVGRDGNAILWDDDLPKGQIHRVNTAPSQSEAWKLEFPANMIATPIIDVANGWVYTASWQYDMGTGTANIVMIKYAYADGAILNLNSGTTMVPALRTLNYGTNGNKPIVPSGEFNVDGTLLYLPLTTFDVNQNARSSVLACGTGAGGCQDSTRRWTSIVFPSVVSTVFPFSNGTMIAAASGSEVYFLSSTDGTVKNLGVAPTRPSGGLQVIALQPGLGTDFYIFNGPASGYPSEIVAIDAPERGELWRLSVGNGYSPSTGMFLAVDDSGQPWMRVGLNLVKPLTNLDYRTARGATPLP